MLHLFIVNPVAGGVSKESLIQKIKKNAATRGLDFQIYQTQGPGEAEAKARHFATAVSDGLRIYSCGGDGTLNEIINGVQGSPNVEVAVVPVGSGNDYARNFTDPAAFLDLEAQIDGSCIAVDLIQINERYAVNLVNVGFDAIVGHQMAAFRSMARLNRNLIYPCAVVASLLTHPLNSQIEYSIEGGSWQSRRYVIAVMGSGAYYGGGFFAAPYAEVDDGLLDFMMIEAISYLELAQLIKIYKRGAHLQLPALRQRIHYQRLRSVRLRAKEEFLMVLDGEDYRDREATIQVLPRAQQFVLPRGIQPKRFQAEAFHEVMSRHALGTTQ